MYTDVLVDPSFFRFLSTCDADLAEGVRTAGCSRCPGRLHRANYPRKPRGGPEAIASEPTYRHSFCCDQEGCRRRVTPPSVRFLGRRVYFAVVVLLFSVLESGPSRTKARVLKGAVGVSVRTLRRWRRGWQSIFPRTRFWIAARARLILPVEENDLPGALLDRFCRKEGDPPEAAERMTTDFPERLSLLLRWLSPLSISTPLSLAHAGGLGARPKPPQRMPDARSEATS